MFALLQSSRDDEQAVERVVVDFAGNILWMGDAMRGDHEICGKLFSYIDLEDRVRAHHPLRVIREIANTALPALTGDFAALYCGIGGRRCRRRNCCERCCCKPSTPCARSGVSEALITRSGRVDG